MPLNIFCSVAPNIFGRYLEHAVGLAEGSPLSCRDESVHNLLVSLYIQHPGAGAGLLSYITSSRLLCDTKYALKQCVEAKLVRSKR